MLLFSLQTEWKFHPVRFQQLLVPKNRIRIPICGNVSVGQQNYPLACIQNHIQIMGCNEFCLG